MNSKKLLRSLNMYAFIALIIFNAISGYFLYQFVLNERLAHIDQMILFNTEYLKEKAEDALATSDYQYFQEKIDILIKDQHKLIISIELVQLEGSKKRIVASSPEHPPVNKPAEIIYIKNISIHDENFDFSDKSIQSDYQEIGYLIIRFNETPVENAVTHATEQFVLLILLTIVIIALVNYKIRKRLIRPYERAESLLSSLKDGNLSRIKIDECESNNIFQLIVQIKERMSNDAQINEILNNKLHRSKNDLNEVRISQYEMINELVKTIEKPIKQSRRLINMLASMNSNEDQDNSFYLLSGTIDDIVRLINESKNLVDNPYTNYNKEPILVKTFYENICNSAIDSQFEIMPARNIQVDILSSFVLLDYLQIQLIVEKLIYLAVSVSTRRQLFVNVMMEAISDEKLSLEIEIKDSSPGMSDLDAEETNAYFNNTKSKIESEYFKLEDLKYIKHLKGVPGLIIQVTPVKGRGNYYRISIECDYNSDAEILKSRKESFMTHVVSIQEDPAPNLLTEHYKIVGIDLNHVQFYKVEEKLEYLINHDIVILDFSTNYIRAIKICNLIKEKDCIIIAEISSEQRKNLDLIDDLLSHGIKEFIPVNYTSELLQSKIDKVLDSRWVLNEKFTMTEFMNSFKHDNE